MTCRSSSTTKQLLKNIVVTNLQSIILIVSKSVVLLVHCIVGNVPISAQNSKVKRFIIVLKTQRPKTCGYFQVCMHCLIKSLPEFTLHDHIKTPKQSFQSSRQLLSLTMSLTKLLIRMLESSWVHVNLFSLNLNLKRRDTKYSITQKEISEKYLWTRNSIFFLTIQDVLQE